MYIVVCVQWKKPTEGQHSSGFVDNMWSVKFEQKRMAEDFKEWMSNNGMPCWLDIEIFDDSEGGVDDIMGTDETKPIVPDSVHGVRGGKLPEH